METLQLSVLDLPPVNPLEILPRFGISGKDAEAIAKFAETISEIRLDQVEAQPAGNGKSAKQLQPNLPITIKTIAADAIEPDINYAEQFALYDRVVDNSPPHPHQKNKGCGSVMKVTEEFIYVSWDSNPVWHKYGKLFINQDKWLSKVCIDASVSGISDDIANIPETTLKPRKHGSIEDYLAKGRNGKLYKYQRYVYIDAGKVYRHHHIPQKQTAAIAAMWTCGASAKEICTALGKKYLSKDIS